MAGARTIALAGFSLGAIGCGGSTMPYRTHLEGQVFFVAPYVAARAEQCEGRTFSLTFGDRSDVVILTDPPIEESVLQLRTCKDTMSFLLDCSDHGYGQQCGAHDWPLPAEALLGSDNELSHELATVAALAPKCPAEKSCRAHKNPGCLEDGLTLTSLDMRAVHDIPPAIYFTTAFYEVERCGSKRAVSIVCQNRAPFLCRTDARDLP